MMSGISVSFSEDFPVPAAGRPATARKALFGFIIARRKTAKEKAAGMSDFAGDNANTKRYFRKIILVVKCAGN
jgi:hypothetical protein